VSRRGSYNAVVVLAALAGVLWLPASGWAGSGGGGLGPNGVADPGSSSGSGSSQSNANVQPGDVTVTASGDGMTIATRASALLRNQLTFSGNAPGADAGDVVEIQRRGRQTGWAWVNTAESQVASDGSFAATWSTNHIGRFAIRAVVVSPGASSARAANASPMVTVTVYRPSIATQYGPGFYGHRTACGKVLKRSTLGVANRTLRCGTPVAVYYQGRTVVVPVIDRGPYANHADWDLTMSTAKALGIGGTATIGAVSVPAGQPAQ
jgi:hypothetical protein